MAQIYNFLGMTVGVIVHGLDDDARRAQYAKLWEQERKDLPIFYLWAWQNIAGISAKVTGFKPIPDGLIRLQGVSLTK